jgi:hypothetical protein
MWDVLLVEGGPGVCEKPSERALVNELEGLEEQSKLPISEKEIK